MVVKVELPLLKFFEASPSLPFLALVSIRNSVRNSSVEHYEAFSTNNAVTLNSFDGDSVQNLNSLIVVVVNFRYPCFSCCCCFVAINLSFRLIC